MVCSCLLGASWVIHGEIVQQISKIEVWYSSAPPALKSVLMTSLGLSHDDLKEKFKLIRFMAIGPLVLC